MTQNQQANQPRTPLLTALRAGPARPAVAAPPSRPLRASLAARPAQTALPTGPGRSGLDSASQPPQPAVPAPRALRPLGTVLPAPLPPAASVLAVIARPGQESADLGAVLSAYLLAGARLSLLCLTRGEASELNSAAERLEAIRPWELQMAAGLLGISSVAVADYPDGRLGSVPVPGLAEHIQRAIRRQRTDLLLVVDPASRADPDTTAVAQAACVAARAAGLPVLARTGPGPGSRWAVVLGDHAENVRAWQRSAVRAHASQQPAAGCPPPVAGGAEPVTGDAGTAPDHELVRWLVNPAPASRV